MREKKIFAAPEGHSSFRLIANGNEWNMVKETLISPDKVGRQGDLGSAFVDIRYLKDSQSTRLAVMFFPAWAVEKFMKQVKKQLQTEMGNWTWIFSNFGNRKVRFFFLK